MSPGRPRGSARPPRHEALPSENLVDGYDISYAATAHNCGTCGRPESTTKLLTFRLWSVAYRKWAGAYVLCEKCWTRFNDRPDPDPLHVEEDAA